MIKSDVNGCEIWLRFTGLALFQGGVESFLERFTADGLRLFVVQIDVSAAPKDVAHCALSAANAGCDVALGMSKLGQTKNFKYFHRFLTPHRFLPFNGLLFSIVRGRCSFEVAVYDSIWPDPVGIFGRMSSYPLAGCCRNGWPSVIGTLGRM